MWCLAPNDDPTLAAYRRHADKAIAEWRTIRPPSAFLRQFARQLPRQARVLDYGCGIGLELAWLRRQGFCVEGMDGTLAFVREARRRNPGISIQQARFNEIRLPEAAYDGIWCQAALMHLPPAGLPQELEKLRRSLKPSGLLGITLAWGRRKGVAHDDWLSGRYIAGYTKSEALRFFRDWGVLDCRVTNHDGRSGRWITVLATPT